MGLMATAGTLDTQVSRLGIVSWNVHWQCGSHPPCRDNAASHLIDLVKEQSAHIAVAIELEVNASTPLHLPSSGLTGWSQVAGSYPGATPDSAGDALAVAVAPKFTVLAEG